uniref:Uncharacterized protein n=1 Tax=Oryza brachyantha TaxID=4533 RepID=J3KU68_ORYBR
MARRAPSGARRGGDGAAIGHPDGGSTEGGDPAVAVRSFWPTTAKPPSSLHRLSFIAMTRGLVPLDNDALLPSRLMSEKIAGLARKFIPMSSGWAMTALGGDRPSLQYLHDGGTDPPFSNFFREVEGVTSSRVPSSRCTSDKTGSATGSALSFLTSLTCAFPPHRNTVITLVFSCLVGLRTLGWNGTMVFMDFTSWRIAPLQLRDRRMLGVREVEATLVLDNVPTLRSKPERESFHGAMEMVGTDAGCTGGGAGSNAGGGSRSQGQRSSLGGKEGGGPLYTHQEGAKRADAPFEEQGKTKRLRKIDETERCRGGLHQAPKMELQAPLLEERSEELNHRATSLPEKEAAMRRTLEAEVTHEVVQRLPGLGRVGLDSRCPGGGAKGARPNLEVREATLMAHEVEVVETEASL